MAAKDPDVRKTVTSLGGKARIAQADPVELTATRRAGAAATNSPLNLARRIARKWEAGEIPSDELTEIRAILAPLMRTPKKPKT